LRDGHAGRLAERLCRVDLVIIDELGYLPIAPPRRTRRRQVTIFRSRCETISISVTLTTITIIVAAVPA